MAFFLPAAAQAQSYRLAAYEIVDSTNALAAEFARSGDAGRLWIVAEQQTGGRGRRGRVWQSPPGNLYASLLLAEGLTAEQTAELGFVAGVALYEALESLLPPELWQKHNFRLKWPNDMLVDGGKLAGILPEFLAVPAAAAESGGAGFVSHRSGRAGNAPAAAGQAAAKAVMRSAAIIGIGVNIGAAPDNLTRGAAGGAGAAQPYPAASLRRLGADCAPPQLFAALSRCWAENYALWNGGRGMPHLRDKWLNYAAYRGEEIRLIRDGRQLSGIFETIDAKGRLVLRAANGERHFISAGDVYFGGAASAAAGR